MPAKTNSLGRPGDPGLVRAGPAARGRVAEPCPMTREASPPWGQRSVTVGRWLALAPLQQLPQVLALGEEPLPIRA